MSDTPKLCPYCGHPDPADLGVPIACEVGWDENREQSLLECEIQSWACEACGGAFFTSPSAQTLLDSDSIVCMGDTEKSG